MNQIKKKKFLVNAATREVKQLSALSQKNFIYSFKTNVPSELELCGNKALFQEILFHLINNASKAYQDSLTNRIILITSQIENEKELSISVTHGGKGLSFLQKKLITQIAFIFKEDQTNLNIYQTNQAIKKFFNGHIKIISQKNKGTTIKCYFPLNQ